MRGQNPVRSRIIHACHQIVNHRPPITDCESPIANHRKDKHGNTACGASDGKEIGRGTGRWSNQSQDHQGKNVQPVAGPSATCGKDVYTARKRSDSHPQIAGGYGQAAGPPERFSTCGARSKDRLPTAAQRRKYSIRLHSSDFPRNNASKRMVILKRQSFHRVADWLKDKLPWSNAESQKNSVFLKKPANHVIQPPKIPVAYQIRL